MKTYTFTFQRYSYFLSSGSDKAVFGGDTQVLLALEPAEYELKLSGEVLKKVSCPGYKIHITDRGGAQFLDQQEKPLAVFPETEKTFREFKLSWSDEAVQVIFGHTEEVDNYPNCDGEHDRYSTRWVAERTVSLNTASSPTATK